MSLPVIDGTYVWLIPDLESEKLCSAIIEELADTYQAPPFQPHITLAGVPDWPEERLNDTLITFTKSTSQFKLPAKHVRCGTFPYRKLTLEIEKTEELEALYQKVDELFEGQYSKRGYPHISFLYSSKPCDKLQDEVNRIERLRPSHIRADRVAMVQCKGTLEDWRMVSVCSMLKESGY